MLESLAGTVRATAVAGIEAEGAGRVAPLPGQGLCRQAFAHDVQRADEAGSVGSGRPPDGRLIHGHHVVNVLMPVNFGMRSRKFRPRPLESRQGIVEHVDDERGLPRTADPGNGDQPLQGNTHVDALEIVLRSAEHFEVPAIGTDRQGGAAEPPFAAQVAGRQRILGVHQFVGPSPEHHVAPGGAGSRAQVENPVRREHDLRVVFHHDQRIAGLAQALQHTDDPPHVPCVQADAGLVEYEQRIHQRCAQCRGEVDALNLAPGERPRLPVQRQVAEAHLAKKSEPAADLVQQQAARLVHGAGKPDAIEESPHRGHGQLHDVVDT